MLAVGTTDTQPTKGTNADSDSAPGPSKKDSAEDMKATLENRAHLLGLRWQYTEQPEPMGRGTIRQAAVRSLNEVNFGFPYQGAQRATLVLRVHPKHGQNVILTIEKGQFLCRLDECSVAVRLDQGKPRDFVAVGPDNNPTTLFIRGYERFVAAARKAKKVYVEAQFYQEGTRVFEFDVSGLKRQ